MAGHVVVGSDKRHCPWAVAERGDRTQAYSRTVGRFVARSDRSAVDDLKGLVPDPVEILTLLVGCSVFPGFAVALSVTAEMLEKIYK